jgi:adenylate kinase
MRIVLLGPPGAGKGTQAVLLSKELQVPHISTGEMLREAVASGSPLGLRVKGILDSGELVPDAVVIDVVRDRLGRADCGAGFLLDGFPRTVEQARALTVVLKELGRELTHVIDIAVPEGVLLERIRGRGQAGSGRTDDSAEVAARRLEVYRAQTAPVAGFYKELGRLISIDGLGSIDEVSLRLRAALK